MAPRGKAKSRARRNTDAVVTEIVRNGVIAVTEEMKTNLMRTAYNIIIYEALDFALPLGAIIFASGWTAAGFALPGRPIEL